MEGIQLSLEINKNSFKHNPAKIWIWPTGPRKLINKNLQIMKILEMVFIKYWFDKCLIIAFRLELAQIL